MSHLSRLAVARDSRRRLALRLGLRLVVLGVIVLLIPEAFRSQAWALAAASGLLYLASTLLRARNDAAADLLMTLGDLPALFGLVHLSSHELGAEALIPAWLIGTTVANLRKGRPALLPLHVGAAWLVVISHAVSTQQPWGYALMQSLALGVAGLVALTVVLERRTNRTDSLTGLLNRRAGLEDLRQFEGKADTTVAFIDLRAFKAINDRYGHLVGDEVLAAVARRLAGNLRRGDVLLRYGGDEFIAASGAPDLEERLRRAFDEPVQTRGGLLGVQARIGTKRTLGGLHLGEVVQEADRRMYADAHHRAEQAAAQ